MILTKPIIWVLFDVYIWVGNGVSFFLGLFNLIVIILLLAGICVVGMHTHLIVLLMGLELLLVSVSFAVVVVAVLWLGSTGFLFGYLLLMVAGAESALALSIVTAYFFVEQHVEVDFVIKLKG